MSIMKKKDAITMDYKAIRKPGTRSGLHRIGATHLPFIIF